MGLTGGPVVSGIALGPPPSRLEESVGFWRWMLWEDPTGVDDEAGLQAMPGAFSLDQNYPNPFNPRTTIPFDIAQHADVQIIVYNVLGQRVLVARDEPMSPGHYQQTIDMSTFASGVYFYEIRVMGSGKARFRDVRKLVLVK